MTDFDRLVPEAIGFFDALAANNTRAWFAANRTRYEREVKRPAEALLEAVGRRLETLTGSAPDGKVYRIHRDVRFSRDKTPYNTHLHLQWVDPATGLCHLFGVSRAYVCAGVGVMGFDKAALGRWRDGIAGPQGAGVAATVAELAGAGFRLDPPELKRVPAPFAQDHPRAALLRRKGIVLWHDLSPAETARPLAALEAAFARLAPFGAALREILGPR